MTAHCPYSYLEVDLGRLCGNVRSVGAQLGGGVELIPVMKCDAYGLGSVPVSRALVQRCGVRRIAVAQVDEGAELREAGIGAELMTLSPLPAGAAETAVRYDLQPTVYSPASAAAVGRAAAAAGKTAYPVQVKIETGLNRIGARPGEELAALIGAIGRAGSLSVAGAFTHFASGEERGDPLAQKQYTLFLAALRQLEAAGIRPPLRHILNSGASEWFTAPACNAARIGRRLYMDSRDHPLRAGQPGAVEDVASWRSSVVSLRDLMPGESLGYGGCVTAKAPMRVALAPAGYGDGLYYPLAAAGGPVLVGERRTRLLAACMDQCFIDVTGLPCAIGDEVTFFGRSSKGTLLPAQQAAAVVGHEGVFLTSLLSNRVERRYIG